MAFPTSIDPPPKDIQHARDNRSLRLSRPLHPGGRELALSIGGAVPQRRVEVTDLVSVIEAVAAFGHDVQAANPAASFEVSMRVVAGRKPRGFDASDKVDAFGGLAFLRSDVEQSALHRRLVDPAAAVDGAWAPELAQ